MGHYDNCRPENCAVCGQLKGWCEHTISKAPPIKSFEECIQDLELRKRELEAEQNKIRRQQRRQAVKEARKSKFVADIHVNSICQTLLRGSRVVIVTGGGKRKIKPKVGMFLGYNVGPDGVVKSLKCSVEKSRRWYKNKRTGKISRYRFRKENLITDIIETIVQYYEGTISVGVNRVFLIP